MDKQLAGTISVRKEKMKMNVYRYSTPLALFIGLVAAALGFPDGTARADEAATVTIEGIVEVVRDTDYNATAVQVTDNGKKPATTYRIVLNTRGLDLADALEAQRASVTGTVTAKDGAKWLKVTGFKEIEPKEVPADDDGKNVPVDDVQDVPVDDFVW